MLGSTCSQPSGALHTVWGSPSCISRHALSSCGLAPRTGHRLLRIQALTPWTIITRSLIAKKELSATRSLFLNFPRILEYSQNFRSYLKKKWKRCAASVVGAYNPLQSQLNLVGTAVEFYTVDDTTTASSSSADFPLQVGHERCGDRA